MADAPTAARIALRVAALISLLGACALVSVSCAPARPATVAELRVRAAFDMACPPHMLQVYPLDLRARGVVGCGRRLTYVERCEPHHGETACSWMLDAPSWGPTTVVQSTAPVAPVAQAPTTAAPPLGRRPPPPSTLSQPLPPEQPPAVSATPPSAEIRDLGY